MIVCCGAGLAENLSVYEGENDPASIILFQ